MLKKTVAKNYCTSNLLLAVLSSPGNAVNQIKASWIHVKVNRIASFKGRLFKIKIMGVTLERLDLYKATLLSNLKKMTCKGTLGRCFICLRPAPLRWPHIPPHTHCIHVLIHTGKVVGWGGGELTREKGQYSLQSRSKIPTWLTVSPVYKLY